MRVPGSEVQGVDARGEARLDRKERVERGVTPGVDVTSPEVQRQVRNDVMSSKGMAAKRLSLWTKITGPA